jgi:hypothetical protein
VLRTPTPATSEGIYVAWEGAFTLHPGIGCGSAADVEEIANPASALPVTTLRLVALESVAAGGRTNRCRRRRGWSPNAGSRCRSTTTA